MTDTPAPGFTIERTGERQYAAKNERGSELVIGYGSGEFSPGDLLKLAILGCNALSSEARFVRALGEEFQITGSIKAHYRKDEDRFTSFDVELEPVVSGLYPEDRELLLGRAARAIARYCTISHTLDHPAPTTLVIDGESL